MITSNPQQRAAAPDRTDGSDGSERSGRSSHIMAAILQISDSGPWIKRVIKTNEGVRRTCGQSDVILCTWTLLPQRVQHKLRAGGGGGGGRWGGGAATEGGREGGSEGRREGPSAQVDRAVWK